jgi:hypothetical protein
MGQQGHMVHHASAGSASHLWPGLDLEVHLHTSKATHYMMGNQGRMVYHGSVGSASPLW